MEQRNARLIVRQLQPKHRRRVTLTAPDDTTMDNDMLHQDGPAACSSAYDTSAAPASLSKILSALSLLSALGSGFDVQMNGQGQGTCILHAKVHAGLN